MRILGKVSKFWLPASSHPVLDALGIKSPTGRYGNVLLAIYFKGRGNIDHAGGCRDAPNLIPRARIERTFYRIGR